MINEIHEGNSTDLAEKLDENSVDMIITSPPYYRLRDYGISGQMGLEETPNEYVDNLVNLFDKCRVGLKDNGTLWLNIGDSYNSTNRNTKADKKYYDEVGYKSSYNAREDTVKEPSRKPLKSIATKSLIGIPFRFATKMIDSGWILRNTIIWHKPFCMPSPTKDRYTVDFEYIFLFSQKPKYYFKTQYEQSTEKGNTSERTKRTVWNIKPIKYKKAHFATYPEELIQSPIDAGCPEGGTVLDPFMGSGTTAVVALKQKKNYIGFELNPEYIKIAEERTKKFNSQLNFD